MSNALGRSDQRCFKLEWQVVRKSGCIALFSPSLCGDWHRRGARLPRRQLHQHRDDVECVSSFYFLTRLQLALASYCPCNEIATSMMAERRAKNCNGIFEIGGGGRCSDSFGDSKSRNRDSRIQKICFPSHCNATKRPAVLFRWRPKHARKVLILDGGTREELFRRGVPVDRKIWSATAVVKSEYHSTLQQVHQSFVQAGADAITTNS